MVNYSLEVVKNRHNDAEDYVEEDIQERICLRYVNPNKPKDSVAHSVTFNVYPDEKAKAERAAATLYRVQQEGGFCIFVPPGEGEDDAPGNFDGYILMDIVDAGYYRAHIVIGTVDRKMTASIPVHILLEPGDEIILDLLSRIQDVVGFNLKIVPREIFIQYAGGYPCEFNEKEKPMEKGFGISRISSRGILPQIEGQRCMTDSAWCIDLETLEYLYERFPVPLWVKIYIDWFRFIQSVADDYYLGRIELDPRDLRFLRSFMYGRP